MDYKVVLNLWIVLLALATINSKAAPAPNNGLRCPGLNEENSERYATLLAHPYNCAKFFYCVHGRLIGRSCPDGLYFNDDIKVCDWKYNVKCTRPSSVPSNDKFPTIEKPGNGTAASPTTPPTPANDSDQTNATTPITPAPTPVSPTAPPTPANNSNGTTPEVILSPNPAEPTTPLPTPAEPTAP